MKRLVILCAVAFSASRAEALPQYAWASAHTCGNCHVSPTYEDQNGWDDPDLSERKCTLSCAACHVDPSGGGLRNTSGRYFGYSSLAMLPLEERSYSDHDQELFDRDTIAWFRKNFGEWTRTSSRTIPSNYEEVEKGIGAGQTEGRTAFGKPFGHPTVYSFWDGRYRDLNADPLLTLGGDIRAAYWTGSRSVFPMQFDLDAAIHPVEHVTAMATLAARGRVAGLEAIGESKPSPFFLRNAFLMAHELPYMGYMKAGIFMPRFGTKIDDHTAFIRDQFEQDFSTPDDRALGVEVGVAPNYPYASASVFRGFAPTLAPDGTDGGWGTSLDFGWRALGWTLGTHGTIKRRPAEARGNMTAAGVSYGLSPFYWFDAIPLTLIGELSVGKRPRATDGLDELVVATYHEAWWMLFNGFSARLKYDFAHKSLDAESTTYQRAAFGLDMALFPGFSVFAQIRRLFDADGDSGTDLFIQAHAWF